jgi:hypothetical protein
MIDEEDDLVAKIRKEFGITVDKKTNYSDANTSGANYVKDPEPVAGKQTQPPKYNYEISDISRDENEEIRGQLIDLFISNLNLGEPIDLDIDYKAVLESADDEEEPAALTRELSRETEVSELTTIQAETDDLELQMERRGIPLIRGPKPTKPEAIEAKNRKMRELIAEYDTKRASAGEKASKKK